MEVTLDVPDYNSETGIIYNWESGFDIDTRIENNTIIISANKEGLISLANHLLNLAQGSVPVTSHLHFDEHNSLEIGSAELIIEKL